MNGSKLYKNFVVIILMDSMVEKMSNLDTSFANDFWIFDDIEKISENLRHLWNFPFNRREMNEIDCENVIYECKMMNKVNQSELVDALSFFQNQIKYSSPFYEAISKWLPNPTQEEKNNIDKVISYYMNTMYYKIYM